MCSFSIIDLSIYIISILYIRLKPFTNRSLNI